MSRDKIVLGLSGGVDSAVSAYLLQEHYDVTALYLSIGPEARGEEDARAVAEGLGIPFRTADISQALERWVKAPFAAAWLAGRTPLPCAVCNPLVKFPALLALAEELGAPLVATGHYARAAAGQDGRARLHRGAPANDQSYLLARLPQDILGRVRFPLGDYDKSAVRALAGERGIPVAHKRDSMELCFIPDDDYAAWLDRRCGAPGPGSFVDRQGRVMGRHTGYTHYTLGQRRGLGVSGPHRYFVSAIDPSSNTVTLSDGSDLWAGSVSCDGINWVSIPPQEGPFRCTVRLRHSKNEYPADVLPQEDRAMIRLSTPARAPTPGQLAVFYHGELVLGSGWITGSAPPGHTISALTAERAASRSL